MSKTTGRMRSITVLAGLAAVPMIVLGLSPASRATAQSYINWSSYLDGVTHNSYNKAATAITQSNAADLTEAWNFMPGAPPVASLGYDINASPTVHNGVVYVGGNNGTFYALNESTGATLWTQDLGYVNPTSGGCGTRGITATATVAPAPSTGTLTVYASGGNGYLYALDAATGAVVWKSLIDLPKGDTANYYDWSSPTLSGGHIYIGVAGSCTDHVRGALLEYSQATGKRQASYYTVPKGMVGGSIWSTAAVASNGDIYVGSGNVLPPTPSNEGTSESVIELNPKGLAQIAYWQIPLADQPSDDSDFGASVSLFKTVLPGGTSATPMVGVCNKNGVYYALEQDDLAAGPVWQTRVAAVNTGNDGMSPACLTSTVVDGDNLYVGGTATTINGTSYAGSIDDLNASTGAFIWQDGLSSSVLGTASLDGSGVLAVGTYGSTSQPQADYLINPTTGAILATVSNGDSSQFAQPVFADGYLLIATETAGMYAYDLPAAGRRR
jgi:polyvinyl alcohol dehydrogenase (cytochrome)